MARAFQCYANGNEHRQDFSFYGPTDFEDTSFWVDIRRLTHTGAGMQKKHGQANHLSRFLTLCQH
jgi:hypothetical protein